MKIASTRRFNQEVNSLIGFYKKKGWNYRIALEFMARYLNGSEQRGTCNHYKNVGRPRKR